MSSLLQAEHITVKFREFTAVDDVSFTLRTGEWLMLLGPNGAGKSTLLRAVSRAVPFEGRVTIRGMDTARFSSRSLARIMGVLSQTHHTEYAYRVEQVVALGRYAHEEGFLRRADPRGREAV